MLTKKADTERKRCKLLSPEKKVKLLETDAAAHKEQCKSLSLDGKSHILNKDADAHKKMQVSHLRIKINLKRIILLHNTNIASPSLLIRKLKF
jgi:hypothetical protein